MITKYSRSVYLQVTLSLPLLLLLFKLPKRERKKLRLQLQQKRYLKIELCLRLQVLCDYYMHVGNDRKSAMGQNYFVNKYC